MDVSVLNINNLCSRAPTQRRPKASLIHAGFSHFERLQRHLLGKKSIIVIKIACFLLCSGSGSSSAPFLILFPGFGSTDRTLLNHVWQWTRRVPAPRQSTDSFTPGTHSPDGQPVSDGQSLRRRHCLSVFKPQQLCSGPTGGNRGPQSPATNLPIVFPYAHQKHATWFLSDRL